MTRYTFGDTDLAAERLRVLDAVFAPTTDSLLAELEVTPRSIADLGCGPGATTARLATRFPDAAVVGLEASESFVAAARAAVPRAEILVADVTQPLPRAPFDFVYARFLAAHLPDIAAALGTWADALAPGGMLVLEETESITSTDPVFAAYETLTRACVATAGASVYAGPYLVPSLASAVTVELDRVLELDVTAGQAAAMFRRNLATWGDEAVAQGLLTEPDRVRLLDRLTERESEHTRGLFTWTHRQVVARRG